jgi:methylated-DNA-[protein]-cysteine S-methyltransferase
MLKYKNFESPVGRLTLVASGPNLIGVLWPNDKPLRIRLGEIGDGPHDAVLVETERQLAQYFRGDRRTFDLPIHFHGTPFQNRVWGELLRIPYGQTRSYRHVAVAIGNGSAARAVGLAVSKNPLSIIVPCHRVVGASGTLTGFAGGLPTKARLLHLESAVPPGRPGLFPSAAKALDSRPPTLHSKTFALIRSA